MASPGLPSDLHPYCWEPRLVRGGNSVTILEDGDEVFPAMLEAIGSATESILLEIFRIVSDDTGWRFADALCERAEAGLEVALLYDGFGCLGNDVEFWRRLRSAGVKLVEFHPISRATPLSRLGVRDHRKVLVMDRRVAFVGGLNLADEYAGPEWDGGNWRDTALRVEGPVAAELASLVLGTWAAAGGDPLPVAAWRQDPSDAGNSHCVVLATRTGDRAGRRSVRSAYLTAAHKARTRITITNPYFVPTVKMRRALRKACQRGVRVQCLLAGESDLKAVKYAGRFLYARMLRWGVEIYEWERRILHAKTATVDGAWATVGSFNMDRLSAIQNLEANVAVLDREVAGELEASFDRDIARSRRIDVPAWRRRPLTERLLEWVCYQFRHWL